MIQGEQTFYVCNEKNRPPVAYACNEKNRPRVAQGSFFILWRNTLLYLSPLILFF